jgi:hypothetical protein
MRCRGRNSGSASGGFRQFLLRGIDKDATEWALIYTAHNLAKLAAA